MSEVEVLVVGGGPVGVATALLAARRGLRARVHRWSVVTVVWDPGARPLFGDLTWASTVLGTIRNHITKGH